MNSETIKNTKCRLEYFNLTPTLDTNSTESLYHHHLNTTEQLEEFKFDPGYGFVDISYRSSVNKNAKAGLYFIIFALFERLWFTSSLSPIEWVSGSGSNSLYSTTAFFTALSLAIITSLVVLQRKKFKMKK